MAIKDHMPSPERLRQQIDEDPDLDCEASPTTIPRGAVARIIDPHALWDLSGVPGFPLSDHYVHVQEKALAKADAILALFPDSPALAALKLAAVNLGTAGEGWPAGVVRRSDIARKERAVLKVAHAFAKEQRETDVPSSPGGEGEGK